MSDLIDRQQAINAIENTDCEMTSNDWDELTDAIMRVPSVQPMQKGWVCPVCGRGLSPLTMVCPCQNGKGWEITC